MKIETNSNGKIQVDLSSLELDPEILEKIKAGLEKTIMQELSTVDMAEVTGGRSMVVAGGYPVTPLSDILKKIKR